MKLQPSILVFAALQAEVKKIQSRCVRKHVIQGIKCQEMERENGKRFMVCIGGVGFELASKALRTVLKDINPDLILNVGSCGGLAPEMQLGDVILPQRIVSIDSDLNPLELEIDELPLEYIRNILSESQIPTGYKSLYSSHTVLSSLEEKKNAIRLTGCGIVDMESYWVVEAAREFGCSACVMRVVLDDSDTELPVFFGTFRGVPVPGLKPNNLIKLPGLAKKASKVSKIIGNAAGIVIDRFERNS